MKTHQAKTTSHTHKAAANAVNSTEQSATQPFQFIDNRPKMVAQRKLHKAMEAKPVRQLRSVSTPSRGTIQMVNRLTMHSSPKDTRLAGGGKGSKISTGKEVNDVIASKNLQDMQDSHRALRTSIAVRESSLNPDVGHAGRIKKEKGWLAKLAKAIHPLEQARLRRRQQMLSGRRPSPQRGPQRGLPASAGWAGRRAAPAAAAPAPAPQQQGVQFSPAEERHALGSLLDVL